MKKLVLAAVAAASLAACNPAQFGVSGSLTSKGYVNRSEVSLGNVYLWDRENESVRRVNFVDPSKHPLTPATTQRDETVTFRQAADFQGGVDLTDAEVADLSLEVARRSSIQAEALTSVGFVDPLNALLEEIRASKEQWYASLELNDDFSFDDNVVLVLVSEVTTGTALTVAVDETAAAGVSFASRTVSAAQGALDFQITDTNQINVTSRDGTVLFARLIPYTASEGAVGVRFKTVKDQEAIASLASVLTSGL